MHSEPTIVSQIPSPDVSSSQDINSSQHGNDHNCNQQVFGILPREDVGDHYIDAGSADPGSSFFAAKASTSEVPAAHQMKDAFDKVDSTSRPSAVLQDFENGVASDDVSPSSPSSHQSKVYVLQPTPRQTLADLPNGTKESRSPFHAIWYGLCANGMVIQQRSLLTSYHT